MGADIHMIAEYQSGSDGGWELNYAVNVCHGKALDVDLQRSYWLFSTLAGVREQYAKPELFEPRGIPADLSRHAQAWWDAEDDLHTPSWLLWPDARVAARAAENGQLAAWLDYACMDFVDEDKQRIIFAFDN